MHHLMFDIRHRHLHDVNSTLPRQPYLPLPYRPPQAVVRTHRLPRFGFPKNVGVLWEGNAEQIDTYIIGIIVGSIVIVGVVAICLFVMAILRCRGYAKVGFWCGRFEYSTEEVHNDDVGGNEKDRLGEMEYEEGDGGDVEDDGNVENGSTLIENGNPIRTESTDSGIGDCSQSCTGIVAVKTIGSGEFVDRENHVSIITGVAQADGGLPEAAPSPNDMAQLIDDGEGDEEHSNDSRGRPEIDPADNETDVTRLDEEGGDTVNASMSKSARKGLRLKTRIDVGEGKRIDLRFKSVPKKLYWKVNAVRLVFIMCGVGAMVSAGLFYALGVKKFKQSLAKTQEGILRVNVLATRSIIVTDNLLDVQETVEDRLNVTDKALDVIVRSCDLESLVNETELVSHYETVKSIFISMTNTTKRLLSGFDDNMLNVIEASTTVYDQTHYATIAFTIMVLIQCVMLVLILAMIIGVGFAAYRIENCFTRFMRRHLLLPFFTLQVILATLFAAIFFIAALSGSDFCISPNLHAKRMLTRVAAGSDEALSPLFTLLLFYLSGCREVNDSGVAEALNTVVDGADEVLKLSHELLDIFNWTAKDIVTYCDYNEALIRHFDDLGLTLHNATHELHDSLDATLNILSCRSIHPVYSSLVHDAVCFGAVGGMTAIFSTMLAIALLSMMMLALPALYPIQQVHPTPAGSNKTSSAPDNNEMK